MHQALENRIPLTDPDLDLDTYRDLVAGFYGFVQPLEQQLALHAPQLSGIHLQERSKTSLLERDLQELGIAARLVPRCAALPDLEDEAAAWGCLYVMEGSTLGGRVIASALGRSLGLGAENGAAYFSGYGARTGELWREFCAALATASVDPLEGKSDRIVATAAATFECLHAWLYPGDLDLSRR